MPNKFRHTKFEYESNIFNENECKSQNGID